MALLPLAMLFVPVAVASTPFAMLSVPVAVACAPFAKLTAPVAVASAPFAMLSAPVAVASAPFAVATEPYAVAKTPVAFAPDPTAVEKAPVAAVTVQPAPVMLPPVPEKHCANAGETPRAVIIPAAAARLRKVPPQSMLLASRLARRSYGRITPEACGDAEPVAVAIAPVIVRSAFTRNRLV